MKANYIEMRAVMMMNPMSKVKETFNGIWKTTEISSDEFQHMLTPLKENLYNFIFKALFFSEEADDVYQEALLRAFKYRNSFNKNKSFKTWLFSIANNEIKRYFNKTNAAAGVELKEHVNLPKDGTHQNEHQKELVQTIYRVAGELNDKQRRVFFLFYDHGFSVKEIAGITGLKEGNIKVTLNHSREKIKEKLGVKND
ncbi:MAG: sigma-70 family RNA polymerase sigma factor [bacterium]|nr:sigma-70 family RNA polymerase sigma factor [bacterium]